MDVAALDTEHIEESGHVIHPGVHGVFLIGPIALAVATVIEVDHGEVLGHLWGDEGVPLVPVDRATDLNDGGTGTVDLVVELDTVDRCVGHDDFLLLALNDESSVAR